MYLDSFRHLISSLYRELRDILPNGTELWMIYPIPNAARDGVTLKTVIMVPVADSSHPAVELVLHQKEPRCLNPISFSLGKASHDHRPLTARVPFYQNDWLARIQIETIVRELKKLKGTRVTTELDENRTVVGPIS